MRRLPNVYPADNVAWPNKNGTFDVGSANVGAKILIRNLTPLNLRLDFYNGWTDTLSAWEHNVWTLDGDTQQVGWSIDIDSPNVISPPSNVVYLTLFEAQEQVPGTYPVFSVLQSSVGNPGGISTTVPSNVFYNVKDAAYGAKGDGITDDTTAIATALSAANSAGGGIVYFPKGTYLSGPQTIYSNVHYMGDGPGISVIQLKNGTNADLFSANVGSINLSQAAGTGSSAGVTNFKFSDLTIDGNRSNQTGGTSYPLRFYGYGYILEDIDIKNGYSGGVLCDYSGPFPSNDKLESVWHNVRVYRNNGIGLEIGGPTDCIWDTLSSYFNNSHGIHSGPNAAGLLASNLHVWSPSLSDVNAVGWLAENSMQCNNCEVEGSDYTQLHILANNVIWHGGRLFTGGRAGRGIRIGQTAGGTPLTNSVNQAVGVTTAIAPQSYSIHTEIQNVTHADGAIRFENDGGGYIKTVCVAATSTNIISTGTKSTKTTGQVVGYGYTADGTDAHSGFTRINTAGNTEAFKITNQNLTVFDVNSFSSPPQVVLPNGTIFKWFSDNFATLIGQLDSSGIVLSNAVYLQGKDSGGVARGLLALDASNILHVRAGSTGVTKEISFRDNADAELAWFDNGGGGCNGQFNATGGVRITTGSISRISIFSGTGDGTFSHGLGATPDIVIPVQNVAGSQTMGYSALTSTQVTIKTGAGLAWTALAIKL